MKAFKKHIIPFVRLVDSWNSGQQKNPHIDESVNEVNMAHVYSKDLSKKKFKDLGLYLAHVLDLSPRYDFKLTSNKKLLAINIDKINPKSLQNIKKRFGIDLKKKAKEPIRLKSKSGMGKISHLGMESVDEARGTCWVGYQQLGMKRKGGKMVPNCVKEITELYYEIDGKGYGYTFEYINDGKLNEAEYQGRKVKLGKIMQGDVKKFKVYVKNPKGNVVKVNFGQGGKSASKTGGTMRIRKSNPKARANFRARHNCDNPGPRHKARYWACRTW